MTEKSSKRPAGAGVGYLSVMMIFVTLCLTMLAALSCSTAENQRRYSEKSAEYTREYYAADLAAKRVLAEVRDVVSEYGDYTDFMLLAELDGMEAIEYGSVRDGLTVNWKTPVNTSQSIYCEVKFSGGNYKILSWQTVSAADTTEKPLNVWDGE